MGACSVNRRICYLPATRTTTAEMSFISTNAEIFRASKIGKMNDVVRYLRDLAAHFPPDLKCNSTLLPALPKAGDCRVRLQGGLVLRERAGTDYDGDDYCNKK